jgi:hypothetical protein
VRVHQYVGVCECVSMCVCLEKTCTILLYIIMTSAHTYYQRCRHLHNLMKRKRKVLCKDTQTTHIKTHTPSVANTPCGVCSLLARSSIGGLCISRRRAYIRNAKSLSRPAPFPTITPGRHDLWEGKLMRGPVSRWGSGRSYKY